MINPYKQVKEFHDVFHPSKNDKPTALNLEEASYRAGFKIEELVEFLYAASNNHPKDFQASIEALKVSIDLASEKVTQKNKSVLDPLVEEVDALIDTLYFVYGSFVLMGVDPTEIFSIVHQANMGKLFPNNEVRYHPVTGKILKPDNWEEKYAPEGKIKTVLENQKQANENP